MQYIVRTHQVSARKEPVLYGYLDGLSAASCSLYNAALFRVRQWFTGRKKEHPTPNEQLVMDEAALTVSSSRFNEPEGYLSYYFLEKLLKVTGNPDYTAGILPAHAAQHAVKQAVNDFSNWRKALKAYFKSPDDFTGKPKIPHYKDKGGRCLVTFSNQESVLRYAGDGTAFLKLPKTKESVMLGVIPDGSRLKEVQAVPFHGSYKITAVLEAEDTPANTDSFTGMCGVDFGVSNTAAIAGTTGKSRLYKGGAAKSANRLYNKLLAEYRSMKDAAKQAGDAATAEKYASRIDAIAKNRENFLHDEMHKISSDIVRWCLEEHIGTIVLGHTKGWKDGSSIGRENNQMFVQMPLAVLAEMIKYKAERAGLAVIIQEESYTSKASFLDGDGIPVYGREDGTRPAFSGKRLKRGLYRSSDGTVINADINGAANILRKAVPDAFEGVTDFSFLQCPDVVRFGDLHPACKKDRHQPAVKCNCVKAIACE